MIAAAVENRTLPMLVRLPRSAAPVAALYSARDFRPAWLGHPGRLATLRAALDDADRHGIEDDVIRAALREADAPSAADASLRLELRLSEAALRYAAAMTGTRLEPNELYSDWAIAVPSYDFVGALVRALDADAVAQWLESLPPGRPEYSRLIPALARYRELARQGGWRMVSAGPPLKRGVADGRVPLLRERLAAEGYEIGVGNPVFDKQLAAAVRAFQRRHGLLQDGVAGGRTIEALNVTAEQRVDQLRANLERWRWMPRQPASRRAEVNAAAATLTVTEDDRQVLAMKTIVGSRVHPTPVFTSAIERIVLNPPWDIPTSIARREILPRAARDPEYLQRNDIVARETTGSGRMRLRQLPGPKNALGQLKFELLSPFDVYLHDTPDRKLFARADRFLSHGCIRLERPRDLALHLLSAQRDWDPERLDAAIATGDTRRIELRQPLALEIAYWTAWVDATGEVQFRDDVYGRDARLNEALRHLEQPNFRPNSPVANANGRSIVAPETECSAPQGPPT